MARLIDFIEPVMHYLPEAKKPIRKVSLKEKFFWSGLALTVYFVMSEVVLFGAATERGRIGELAFMNIVFASKNGTLMHLGVGPIVTAGLIMQLLVGAKLIKLDFTNPRDKALFTGAQKFLTLVVAAIEAVAFAVSGVYGPIGLQQAVLIILQLMTATLIVLLLDEMIQKGWGLGSGVSLFIAGGVAQQIFWLSFSPIQVGEEPLGAIPAFISALMQGKGMLNAFSRSEHALPDMVGFITTVAVLFMVAYFEGMRIEVPISYAKYGGVRARIPLNFLYVSNIPIILTSALTANLFYLTQILWSRYPDNFLVNLLGSFTVTEARSRLVPTGGLIYYLTPPRGIVSLYTRPLQVLIYSLILCGLCVFFAIAWVETSGLSARDQAERIVESGLQVPGFRSSPKVVEKILERYVSTLTVLSGLMIGLLAVIADLLNAIGSGIGILLMVGILHNLWEIIARERALEMYPLLERLLKK
ncbi:MAG: preprotein translocase subunit SecY [Candidatus Nezhaarchaeales archaeon]